MKVPSINRLLSRAQLADFRLKPSPRQSEDFFAVEPKELADKLIQTIEKKFEFKVDKEVWFINSVSNRIYGIIEVNPESMGIESFPGEKKVVSYVIGCKESSVGDCAFAFFAGVRLASGELVVTQPYLGSFRHKKTLNFEDKLEETIEGFSTQSDAAWGKVKVLRTKTLQRAGISEIILRSAFENLMPFRYCEYVYRDAMKQWCNQDSFSRADLHSIFFSMSSQKMSFMVRTELLWKLHDLIANAPV